MLEKNRESLSHAHENFLSILYDQYIEFNLHAKCLKDFKEMSFSALTQRIASDSRVLICFKI